MTLFSEVNVELINNDKSKKSRGKHITNRYPVSPIFTEATEQMQIILRIMKSLKVISLSELKRSRTATEV